MVWPHPIAFGFELAQEDHREPLRKYGEPREENLRGSLCALCGSLWPF
jgi:hypothetical protein